MADTGPLPEPVDRTPSPVVFRISRQGRRPFAPVPWAWAPPGGVLNGRFADPRPWVEAADSRFRMVYAASTREAAFGELLAPMRPALIRRAPSKLAVVERGLVPSEWWTSDQIGQAQLAPNLRFVDISAHRTLTYLRAALAPLARELAIEDIDLSVVTGPQRRFTRACALHLHDLRAADGTPRFAGIRYPSRLSASWECWAIFADRLEGVQSLPRPIVVDDPDMLAAAAHLGLTVEGADSG